MTGRPRPRDRRRHAERPRARRSTRAARSSRRAAIPIEPYVSPAARLGRAGPGALLAGDRRGLPALLGRRRSPDRTRSPASTLTTQRGDGRRHRRRRHARSGRRSSGSTSAGREGLPPIGGVDRPRVPGARRARHRRRVPGRLRGELDPRERAGGLGARSATTCSCRASSTHRLTGRFVDSVAAPGRLPPVRLQAPRAGPSRGDWQLAGGAGRPGLAAGARPADRAARRADRRRGGRVVGPAGRARRSSPPPPTRPARCSARARSTPDVAVALVRHDRDDQHDPAPLRRGRSRSSRRTPPRSRARTRLEVQVYRGYWMVEWFKREFGARGGRPGRELGRRARGPLRRARPADRAGLDGPDCSSRTGRPASAIPGPRGEGRDRSASATSTPGPTSTGRSSRASPTRCARAASARPARAKVPLRELRVVGRRRRSRRRPSS